MKMFYNYERSKEYLINFCKFHDIELTEKNLIGFGRPCVGLLKNESYIKYNSFWYSAGANNNLYDSFNLSYYFKNDKRFENLRSENAYHKNDCFVVLCKDELFSYRNAITELANWVYSLDKISKISIKKYEQKYNKNQISFAKNNVLYEMVLD